VPALHRPCDTVDKSSGDSLEVDLLHIPSHNQSMTAL